MKKTIKITLAALALLALGACSSQGGGKDVDPFQQYRTTVNAVGGMEGDKVVQDTSEARQEFQALTSFLCAMSKEEVLALKEMGSMQDNPLTEREPVEVRKRKALQLSTTHGAIWEFGCGRGHDAEIYAPRVVKNEPAPGASAPTTEGTPDNGKKEICDDREYWESQQSGDPGDYEALCGHWPTWLEEPVGTEGE